MTDKERIEHAIASIRGKQPENREVARQNGQQEHKPSHHEKQKESEWSSGSAAGGTWRGYSR